MKHLYSAILLMVTLGLQGQSLSPYASIEENIHFTDIPRTEGAIGLSDLASNAGLRLGAYYTYNNLLSGEITLGVIGIGTPNVFSNTIVPVEIVGHYNIFNGKDVSTLSKFNIDFGIGTGPGEASDGYFGQSEHVVFGASMHLPNALPIGTVILGSRFTYFRDDYLDNYTEEGAFGDATIRIFAGVQLDNSNQKAKQALIQAEAQAKEVTALLEKVNLEKSKLENQLNVAEKRHSREKAVLQDELEALKSSQFTENTETTESKDSPKNDTKTSSENRKKVAKGNYHIIIGSFQTRGMAELFLEDNGLDCKITFIKDLDTYRVVFSSHASLIEARKAKEEAQSITENAWIAVH